MRDTPTPFAHFFLEYAERNGISGTLAELGCGAGHDVRLLGSRFSVDGYDLVNQRDIFVDSAWQAADVVYSRFLLHLLTDAQVREVVRGTRLWFVAEARAVGDVPILFDHWRNLVDPERLMVELIGSGFDILFFQVGRGLAEFRGEDPLVIRVMAKRRGQ